MKVLIVDDEPLVRRSLGRACKTAGHEVYEAGDGREGLELWTKVSPDLVFLDVLMPGLTGPQVLEALPTEVRKATKIIMMSAFSGQHNMQSALQMGADLFISKPFEDIFTVVKMAEGLMNK